MIRYCKIQQFCIQNIVIIIGYLDVILIVKNKWITCNFKLIYHCIDTVILYSVY